MEAMTLQTLQKTATKTKLLILVKFKDRFLLN